MAQSLSRADRTLSKITYEITLDRTRTRVERLQVTTLCAQKSGAGPIDRKTAFTSAPHIAFVATYRLSNFNKVQRFKVPRGAARLLK